MLSAFQQEIGKLLLWVKPGQELQDLRVPGNAGSKVLAQRR
jgi:hypothetical protein